MRPLLIRALAAAIGLACLFPPPAAADTRREQFPQIYTMTPVGVNLQTGTFMRSSAEFTIGSMSFVRSWRTVSSMGSAAPANDDHWFGQWNHNLAGGVRVESTSDGTIANVIVDGKRVQFILVGNASVRVWQPWDAGAPGASLTGGSVSSAGGNMVYQDRHGAVFTMNAYQQLVLAQYPDGTRIDYSYDASRRLRTALSNRGDAIVLDYGANGKLSTACGYNRAVTYVTTSTTCAGAQLKTSYTYLPSGPSPMLATATDAGGHVRSFQYDTGANLRCITLPDSSTCEFVNVYDLTNPITDDIIASHTTATGEVWQFGATLAAMYEEPAFPGQYRPTYGEMTDPEGKGLSGEYINGFLQQLWDSRTGGANYEWYAGEVSKVIHPEGNSEELQYDNRHNVTAFIRHAKPGSGLADTTWTAAFEQPPVGTGTIECPTLPRKICNKPLYEIDERSGRTDYTYDPNHGGVLTETGPIVGGIRPQTRYTYVQRYAWIKNASGGYSTAPAPVWLLTSKSLCKTGAASSSGTGCAAGASDEVVTSNDYGPDSGPNTLTLRGTVADSSGLALRTCYGYDWKGNRISETSPRAGLASCP